VSNPNPAAIAAARARILQELAALDAEERRQHLTNAAKAASARDWRKVAEFAGRAAKRTGTA
jgi:hypothetical protein